MPLINSKVDLSFTWIENCVLSVGENIDDAGVVANAGTAATLKITDAKLYVPIDSVKLSKLSSEGFKRLVYWNKCKVIPDKNETGTNDWPKPIRELLDSSYQGVKTVCFCLR